jgi:hypothetical protein
MYGQAFDVVWWCGVCQVLGGDFLKPGGLASVLQDTPCDVMILKHVLHDWPDQVRHPQHVQSPYRVGESWV